MEPTDVPGRADLIVVNTCAFIDAARARASTPCSISPIGDGQVRASSSPAVWRSATATSLPPPCRRSTRWPASACRCGGRSRCTRPPCHGSICSTCPRPPATSPWAYVKIAEGCDRRCGFCAIPSFRGPQRSRPLDVDPRRGRRAAVFARWCSWPRTWRPTARTRRPRSGPGRSCRSSGPSPTRVDRVRLLYLYPSDLSDALIDAICATGVPYFDLSLQHVSKPLLRRMRRWGDGARFLRRIDDIRRREPDRRLPQQLHRRLPRRDRARPRRAAAFRRGGRPRLVRVLRLQSRGRDLRGRGSTARCPMSSSRSGSPS